MKPKSVTLKDSKKEHAWRVVIKFEESQVTVVHQKKQEGLGDPRLVHLHFSIFGTPSLETSIITIGCRSPPEVELSWELCITWDDLSLSNVKSVRLYIDELDFSPSLDEAKRTQLLDVLTKFSPIHFE